ncbi:hypothetical protein OOJ91_13820 [Micromonospora lupini]|uniref:hypothetical protein n=1 Tax=Micromonospora lupini TaxID=285679 RepID=UPI00225BCEBB|nr:hypothetical protein [Micromonospora lupini]MCX5066925.1 hypothetical protein [Micromonospora lupini]
MTAEQLTLAVVPLVDRAEGYEARHQVGQYRTPWTWATGPRRGDPTPQAGDLVPAWRCCHCGAIVMTRYALETNHDCCRDWAMPSCYYHPPRADSPYRMDAHWIPPEGWATR